MGGVCGNAGRRQGVGVVKRCEVYWVNLDPTRGTEIRKIRPCLIVSPDDLNAALPRVLVAPITSKGQSLACRPVTQFKGKSARVLLDQTRCVDKTRLGTKMGEIPLSVWHPILLEMLA